MTYALQSSGKKALLVYNPSAGTAVDIDICLGAVIDRLCKEAGYIVTVCATSPNQGYTEVISLIDGGYDMVVAGGGDGTVRLVLGAVAQVAPHTPVAIIPIGTGNQLARNLQIYKESLLTDPLDEAIRIMLHGHPEQIDLGVMNGEYFCVAAGAGPLSDAVAAPSRGEKANLKMLAYVGSIIQTLALPPVNFRVKAGSDDFQVAASGIFVTNVADLGVGTLSGTAQINDGLLDLCILNPREFGDYLELGFRFAGGFVGGKAPYYIRKITSVNIQVVAEESHLSYFQAIVHKVRTVLRGESQESPVYHQVMAMLDGDPCGSTPISIQVIPHAVTVLMPH